MNQSLPTSHSPRIAVVSACWHREIVQSAVSSLRAELRLLGLPASQIDEFERPGAFELPLAAQRLAATGRYRAIVACGLVVDGGIYRHDFVAAAVIDGLMRVQLDSGVPVFSVVLTPHQFHDHEVHQRFFAQHFVAKGREAAQACLQTLAAEDQLAMA
ncbi:MAG: 6,7-dimethyl-8-ribityllumazine synthase [Roseateles depolymerans]|uniref:6,7-dimethyl-8-ribityllumazine synthase n=1 Tax=Roseateles depolymerans TaxID=76731 RepID=A0A2W5DRI2_9BURK|nr:MAG: 6,7-dimethyl-8-ribityllumazine synthase [Roseateles depolymerans]